MVNFCYEKVAGRLYKFSFEGYAKNVREKPTKCSLKTTHVLLDAGGDIYEGTIVPNCFNSHTNSWCLFFV